MKKFLILPLMCLAMTVQAAMVLWQHSFSEDAVVHNGADTYSITEYAENVLGGSLYNVAYMIKNVTTDSYIDFVWYDQGTFIDRDSVNWVEGPDGSGYEYTFIQQAVLGDVEGNTLEDGIDWNTFTGNWDDEVIAELFLYDENADTFTKFAFSDTFTLSDERSHTWVQGTINPPVTDTWFTDFYTIVPVPEPSIAILAMLGVCALLLRRKHG